MKKFSFRAILAGHTVATEEMADRIYESGCDDSLVGSTNGVVMVDFDRQAESFAGAIRSAKDDIRAAGYVIDRIEFDIEESGVLSEAG